VVSWHAGLGGAGSGVAYEDAEERDELGRAKKRPSTKIRKS